jgi:hypothetical protein
MTNLRHLAPPALFALWTALLASGAGCSATGTMGNEMSLQDIGTPSPGHEIRQPGFGETMKEGLLGNPYRLPPSLPPAARPGTDAAAVRQMCVDATYDYENQVLRFAMAHAGPALYGVKTATDYFKECQRMNGLVAWQAAP